MQAQKTAGKKAKTKTKTKTELWKYIGGLTATMVVIVVGGIVLHRLRKFMKDEGMI